MSYDFNDEYEDEQKDRERIFKRYVLALFTFGSGISKGLAVLSCLFFLSVAIYTSFNFLKGQISFRNIDPSERSRIAQITLAGILKNKSPTGRPYFLKRQGLILDLLAGLVLPTMIFMLSYLVMDTLNIFAVNVFYVLLIAIVLIAALNQPINLMRVKAIAEVKRLG